MRRRTLEEVKNLYSAYNSNLPTIKNHAGKEKIILQINALREFIQNPEMDLEEAIRKSSGEEQRTFRWIRGDLI